MRLCSRGRDTAAAWLCPRQCLYNPLNLDVKIMERTKRDSVPEYKEVRSILSEIPSDATRLGFPDFNGESFLHRHVYLCRDCVKNCR